MTPDTLDVAKDRFNVYAAGFRGPGGALPFALQLKFDHSHRVADDAASIAAELGWNEDLVRTGRAAGLLHDIGRFTQYSQFKTFLDAHSLNHGERGRAVLLEQALLDGCDPSETLAILAAVRHHNCRQLPEDLPPAALPVVRLVRDADKLDILHVINDFVRNKRFDDYPEILLHVDIKGPATPALIRELSEKRTASYENLHSLADINLLRMTWVYSVNYLPTLRLMDRRRLYDELQTTLPAGIEVQGIVDEARAFMAARLREGWPLLHA
jgi:putative nucleotidyltransferase with HDIG domain